MKKSSCFLIASMALCLASCSESASAEKKAIEFCKRDQLQKINLASLPSSYKAGEHIASQDLKYLEAHQKRRGKGLLKGLSAGIDKVAPWMAEAMSKHIQCSVLSTKKGADGVWEIELKQEVPDFKHENPLAAMGSLMGAPDQQTLQTIVDGWVKASDGAIKTNTHTMRVGKEGEHLVIFYGLKERAEQERRDAEVRALEEDLAKAKEELAGAQKAQGVLSKLKVKSASFELKRQRFGGKRPFITLTVKSELGQAVSRAYFQGTLKSPGRSIPWVKDTFNHSIRGGLEPGEEVTWKLRPNMFSDWGSKDIPDDAVLEVSVVGLDGADDKELARMPSKSKGLSREYLTPKDLETKVKSIESKRDELLSGNAKK